MIKTIVRSMLRTAGLQVVRIPRAQFHLNTWAQDLRKRFIDKIARDPLDAGLHLEYAVEVSKIGLPYLAYAEMKTAAYLGADREVVKKYEDEFRRALPELEYMNHNQYFRFSSLADEIAARAGGTDLSVLDVGGGEGELAAFIPTADYCLAEPGTNGISGTALPFPDRSFDYVVSCHVLEHIPVGARVDFLDQLLSKARRGLILLNPFYVENSHVDERLRLIIDITGAPWAEEHMNCTLPRLEDIRDYADKRGLQASTRPNGTMTTSLAFVFMDYFASKSGLHDDWNKVSAFFNRKYVDILDSARYPNAYLIYLGRPQL